MVRLCDNGHEVRAGMFVCPACGSENVAEREPGQVLVGEHEPTAVTGFDVAGRGGKRGQLRFLCAGVLGDRRRRRGVPPLRDHRLGVKYGNEATARNGEAAGQA